MKIYLAFSCGKAENLPDLYSIITALGKLGAQAHNFVKRMYLFALYLFALIISYLH